VGSGRFKEETVVHNANLYSVFHDRFEDSASQPCLRVPGGETLTYGELDELSARMSSVLKEAGLGIGDRLVAQVDKSVANVALYMATLRAGAVFVPLNNGYTADELRYFVDDAEPAVIVANPAVPSSKTAASFTMDSAGAGSLTDAANAADPDRGIIQRDSDDLASIIYTSGTTGRSKGAMLTHRNLSSNGIALHQSWGFEDGDVLLHCLPIYHVHGLMVALHTAMLNVSEIVFLPRFDVDQVLMEIPRATVMTGVPTYYSRLLANTRFDAEMCAGMRLFMSGSAPMTTAVHSEFTDRTGHRILERYGMSEAGMITSNPYVGERIPGTVGFPLPDTEVRVCDTSGSELSPGESGIVEIHGPGLFSGYWKRQAATEDAMRPDGFFVTGDIGNVDQHGRLTLEGRSSDMIISGGLNVYPKEIEILIDEHEDVVESAVVGLPHADLGEAVTAFLVPKVGVEIDSVSVATTLTERIARFKHPKRYVTIGELPRNAMGKIQKNVLRTRYASEYEG
jgi:malonyl-CoA/methylmalonyl-CoA synthetase